MDWLKKLVIAFLGLFGLSTVLSAKKSKEVKTTKKAIKKLLDYSDIQKFIKDTFHNFKEVLENEENLKEEWIKYNERTSNL